jgi:hypothetical protein
MKRNLNIYSLYCGLLLPIFGENDFQLLAFLTYEESRHSLPFYIEKSPIYVRFLPPPPLGISDFDAQVSGIQFWKAAEKSKI